MFPSVPPEPTPTVKRVSPDSQALLIDLSPPAAHQAILNQSIFNLIHNETLIKVDIMIRKREDYRLVEFERRQRITVQGSSLSIVSKEDLVLSKLDWAKESQSQCQLADVEYLLAIGTDLRSRAIVSKIEHDRYADTGFSIA